MACGEMEHVEMWFTAALVMEEAADVGVAVASVGKVGVVVEESQLDGGRAGLGRCGGCACGEWVWLRGSGRGRGPLLSFPVWSGSSCHAGGRSSCSASNRAPLGAGVQLSLQPTQGSRQCGRRDGNTRNSNGS